MLGVLILLLPTFTYAQDCLLTYDLANAGAAPNGNPQYTISNVAIDGTPVSTFTYRITENYWELPVEYAPDNVVNGNSATVEMSFYHHEFYIEAANSAGCVGYSYGVLNNWGQLEPDSIFGGGTSARVDATTSTVEYYAAYMDALSQNLTYTWDYDDGNTGSGSNPTHTYADSDIYHYDVIVNGHPARPADTLRNKVVNVGIPTTDCGVFASFGASDDYIEVHISQFNTAERISRINCHVVIEEITPAGDVQVNEYYSSTYAYSSSNLVALPAGEYKVTIAYDNPDYGCSGQVVDTVSLPYAPPPCGVALVPTTLSSSSIQFTASYSDINPLHVDHTWTVTDEQEYSILYDHESNGVFDFDVTGWDDGIYNVRLYYGNPSYTCNGVEVYHINVSNGQITTCYADYSYAPVVPDTILGDSGLEFEFTEQSNTVYPVSSGTVDFGDGTSPVAFLGGPVTHTFPGPGTYSVCYTIQTTDGCSDTRCRDVFVGGIDQQCFTTDCVFPGDANYDGVVNGSDILAMCVGTGLSGPMRPNATTQWVGQPAPDWAFGLDTGVNDKHCDANGNGMIESGDYHVAYQNYFMTHNGLMTTNTVQQGPELYLDWTTATMELPQDLTDEVVIVQADLMLGSPEHVATNYYGLQLSLDYDESLISMVAMTPAYNSVIGGSWNSHIRLIQKPGTGQADIVASRTNGYHFTGHGRIGRVHFYLDGNALAAALDADTSLDFSVSISNEQAIDNQMNLKPLVASSGGSMTLLENTGSTVSTAPVPNLATLVCYPNPVTDRLTLELPPQDERAHIKLYDINGQLLHTQLAAGTRETIDMAHLPTGTYLLQVVGETSVATRKIVKQ